MSSSNQLPCFATVEDVIDDSDNRAIPVYCLRPAELKRQAARIFSIPFPGG